MNPIDGEMGGCGNVVDVIALDKLCELIRCKGWATVSIDQTRQSVLRYELLQAHTQ